MAETHTALLVMDVQTNITARYSKGENFLTPVQSAIESARSAGIPVIYVIVTFRPGFPEISVRNRSFGTIKQQQAVMAAMTQVEVDPAVAPQADEVVITKRRVSAFTGSDLEVVLRGLDISHLVLTGIATSGVVLSTLREAADKDYQLTVLSDCCFDNDEEVHRVLLTKVFPRQAEVIQSAEWQERLKG